MRSQVLYRAAQEPVCVRRMQRFLQFRLGSNQLPIVLGRFDGGQHVARASRVCTQWLLQMKCT